MANASGNGWRAEATPMALNRRERLVTAYWRTDLTLRQLAEQFGIWGNGQRCQGTCTPRALRDSSERGALVNSGAAKA